LSSDIDPDSLSEFQKAKYQAGYVPIPRKLQKYFDYYEWIKREDLDEFRKWFSSDNKEN
jgi:hypothetical protein